MEFRLTQQVRQWLVILVILSAAKDLIRRLRDEILRYAQDDSDEEPRRATCQREWYPARITRLTDSP